MEIIESIMLYGFYLGMLGVDLPGMCAWVYESSRVQYHGEVDHSTVVGVK